MQASKRTPDSAVKLKDKKYRPNQKNQKDDDLDERKIQDYLKKATALLWCLTFC